MNREICIILAHAGQMPQNFGGHFMSQTAELGKEFGAAGFFLRAFDSTGRMIKANILCCTPQDLLGNTMLLASYLK